MCPEPAPSPISPLQYNFQYNILFILKSEDAQKREVTKEQINNLAFQNVVNTIKWDKLDILLSTPIQLESILKIKDK